MPSRHVVGPALNSPAGHPGHKDGDHPANQAMAPTENGLQDHNLGPFPSALLPESTIYWGY